MERVRAVLSLVNKTGIIVVFHDEALLLESSALIRSRQGLADEL